eukprot:1603895-Pyramimonas_sp.AAC.1
MSGPASGESSIRDRYSSATCTGQRSSWTIASGMALSSGARMGFEHRPKAKGRWCDKLVQGLSLIHISEPTRPEPI